LLGTILASGKLRDFELAQSHLSDAVHTFLQSHLEGHSALVPVAREDLVQLRERFHEAEVLAGLRPSCESRY
jgi:hypothetical protein